MTHLLLTGGQVLVGGVWQHHDVRIHEGRVVEVAPRLPVDGADVLDVRGHRVGPGWLELQVNGTHGVDLTTTPDGVWDVGAHLARQGVTAFLPTIVSAPSATVDAARAVLRAGPPAGYAGAVPLGLHVEGPMLAPSRRGAHDPAMLRPADVDRVAGWSPATGVVMATLAPELPGALDVVAALVEAGVVVSAGHTEATWEQAVAGIAAGISFGTHVGNAMPAIAARAPGVAAALVANPHVRVGCIADGVHLAPGMLHLLWVTVGPDRLVLVTDAMAAAGTDGRAVPLGSHEVRVVDGRATLADGTLAGSVATLDHCLRHLREVTGAPLAQVLRTVTTTPAAVVRDADRGRVAVGARADLTVLTDDLDVVATVVGGAVVHTSLEPPP